MASLVEYNIQIPADRTMKIGDSKVELRWDRSLGNYFNKGFTKAQMVVDSEVLRYMNPLTPMRSGNMIESSVRATAVGSGKIQYNAPYARRQYYENKGGSPLHPAARGRWFETMKLQHKDDILKKAAEVF